MKNNYTTYLLLVGVALVWGLLITRIVGATYHKDQELVPVISKMNKPVQRLIISPDTESLQFGYKDPFLKEETSTLKKKKADTTIGTKKGILIQLPTILPVDISFVRYEGYIGSNRAVRTVAILVVHGKEYISTVGKKVDDVILTKITPLELTVQYHHKTYYIFKEHGQ